MTGHARRRRRIVWYDPVGDVCKWAYGLGIIATLGLLGQIVHHQTAQPTTPLPPRPASATAADLPLTEQE
ncbi:hypothetical protein ACH4UT_27405 [Streptomyces sp. NPDC020799]|uniref:hypothetical protein n=1 Tax=Streptomyces sp. NPDC020799 TaxID=3365091 RepID=UPI0037AF036F